MSASESSTKVSRLGFVRRMILREHLSTLEQIQDAWKAEGNSESDLPSLADMRTAKSVLRKKYQVADLSEIPRKTSGKLNVTSMLRMVVEKYPNHDQAKIRKMIESDGIQFSNALWHAVRSNKKFDQDISSPDENQNAGPRARRTRRGRKPGRKIKTEVSVQTENSESFGLDLLKLEQVLDNMIQTVQGKKYSSLANSLREARRHVCKGILDAVQN